MRVGILFLSLLLLIACNSSPENMSLKDQIADLETRIDSLERSNNRENVDQLFQTREQLAKAYEAFAEENKLVDSMNAEQYLSLAANLYQNTLKDLNKALELNDKIINEYPGTEKAIFALFNKGYIYNNYIRDTSKAKVIYTDFINKYPDHKLATDASVELKFLGKSAKEMLEEIQKNNQNLPQ